MFIKLINPLYSLCWMPEMFLLYPEALLDFETINHKFYHILQIQDQFAFDFFLQ